MSSPSRKFILSEILILSITVICIILLIISFFLFKQATEVSTSINSNSSDTPVTLEIFLEQDNNNFVLNNSNKKITIGENTYQSSDLKNNLNINKNQLAKVEVEGYFTDFISLSKDVSSYSLSLYKKTPERYSMLNAGNTNLASIEGQEENISLIKSLFESSDIVGVNLETVFSEQLPTKPTKNTAQNTKANILKNLKVDFAALGNNKLYTQKESGIKNTELVLTSHGISFAGSCTDNTDSCKQNAKVTVDNNNVAFFSFTTTRGWKLNQQQPVSQSEVNQTYSIQKNLEVKEMAEIRRNWGFDSEFIYIPKMDRFLGEAWSEVEFFLETSHNKQKITDQIKDDLLKSFLEVYPEMSYYNAEKFKGGAQLWQKEKLESIKEAKAGGQNVVVYIDNYTEFADLPTLAIKNIAQETIKAGADMVIHTGANSTSGVEFFQNKPIVYNLGNFLTDTNNEDGFSSNLLRTIWSKDTLVSGKLIPINLKQNVVSVSQPGIGNNISAGTIENSYNLNNFVSNYDGNAGKNHREKVEIAKNSSIPKFKISNGFTEFGTVLPQFTSDQQLPTSFTLLDLNKNNSKDLKFVKNEFSTGLIADSDTDSQDDKINNLFEIQGKHNLGNYKNEKSVEFSLSPVTNESSRIKSKKLIPISYSPSGQIKIKFRYLSKDGTVPIKLNVDGYADWYTRSNGNYKDTVNISKDQFKNELPATDQLQNHEILINMEDLNTDKNYAFNKINLDIEMVNPVDKATNLIVTDLIIETIHSSKNLHKQSNFLVTREILNAGEAVDILKI